MRDFDLQAALQVAAERPRPHDAKYLTRLRRTLRETMDAYEAALEEIKLQKRAVSVAEGTAKLCEFERAEAVRTLGRYRLLVERQGVA